MIEKAILSILSEDKDEIFIPCLNKAQQESIRTQAYYLRKKLAGKYVDEIGIIKVNEEDQLFIRIYKKIDTVLYERDKNTGKLVPVQKISELDQLKESMRKDGISEEEINKYFKGEEVI